jgi:nucleotide-binding universal stress UspA family protein
MTATATDPGIAPARVSQLEALSSSAPYIAVGVDFSLESQRAVRQALEIARTLDRELVLVHVAPVLDSLEPPPTGTRGPGRIRDHLAEMLARGREQVTELREQLAREGARVRHAVIEDLPDAGLITAAGQIGADLMVVGTHGYSGLDWLLFGSVALRVIRRSDVDVLVAREPQAVGGFRRILVGTDFSPSASRAFDRARELAAPDAEIDVVHMYHGQAPAALYDEARGLVDAELDGTVMAELERAGQSFIGERRDAGPVLRFYAARGRPVTGLLGWLGHERFDLVAIGSHGRHDFTRWMLGSAAEAVARRAPCSVLVARGPVLQELT